MGITRECFVRKRCFLTSEEMKARGRERSHVTCFYPILHLRILNKEKLIPSGPSVTRGGFHNLKKIRGLLFAPSVKFPGAFLFAEAAPQCTCEVLAHRLGPRMLGYSKEKQQNGF